MENSWRGKEKRHDVRDDDYAASTLEEMGIPSSDPAWYDVHSESYNYHDGMGVCLNMIRLGHAIISLSFHPSGEILAVASGTFLHLWDYDEEGRKLRKKQGSEYNAAVASTSQQTPTVSELRILNRDRNSEFPTSRTVNIGHESQLRCVHFPPCGSTIIIGGVNPTSANEGLAHRPPRQRGGMSGGGMSFHLRLWEFDLEAVLNPENGGQANNNGNNLGGTITDEGEVTWNFIGTRRPLSDVSWIILRLVIGML
jgi:WD40 repeat protein